MDAPEPTSDAEYVSLSAVPEDKQQQQQRSGSINSTTPRQEISVSIVSSGLSSGQFPKPGQSGGVGLTPGSIMASSRARKLRSTALHRPTQIQPHSDVPTTRSTLLPPSINAGDAENGSSLVKRAGDVNAAFAGTRVIQAGDASGSLRQVPICSSTEEFESSLPRAFVGYFWVLKRMCIWGLILIFANIPLMLDRTWSFQNSLSQRAEHSFLTCLCFLFVWSSSIKRRQTRSELERSIGQLYRRSNGRIHHFNVASFTRITNVRS